MQEKKLSYSEDFLSTLQYLCRCFLPLKYSEPWCLDQGMRGVFTLRVRAYHNFIIYITNVANVNHSESAFVT